MSEVVTSVLAGAALPLVFSANWLAVEGIRLMRSSRHRNQATATAAEAQAKAMEAMGRSANEMGRKLASGSSFQEVFASVEAMHAKFCQDPGCPGHGNSGG